MLPATPPETMVSRLCALAREHPEQILVEFEESVVTAGQLFDRAARVGNGLRALGIPSQSRVALLSKNTPVFYELLYGAGIAGMVLVPINYRLAAEEVAYILRDAGTRTLFVSAEYVALADEVAQYLPELERTIQIDENSDYISWRDGHEALVPDNAEIDRVAMQMYTSGTTGRPKGALLTHANLAAALRNGADTWGPWRPHDRLLVCMPQYHIGASIWGMAGIWLGIPSILSRQFVPDEAIDAIGNRRVTKTQLAAVMMRMLLDDPAYPAADFTSLDLIIYGASPAPPELIRRSLSAFGCDLAQGYGMTETSGSVTYLPPSDHADPDGPRLGSAGRAIVGVEIIVADELGISVPSGTIGEVLCRGEQVTQGYWNLPDATAASLKDGWFRTGDAGYLDGDGYLFICDRVKDMIVSGGENIYPAEIEAAIIAHPAVADVAVIGIPDNRWGEAPKAVVVLVGTETVTADALIAFVEARIARFKVPRVVEFAAALPRNASGKILKRELRAAAQNEVRTTQLDLTATKGMP